MSPRKMFSPRKKQPWKKASWDSSLQKKVLQNISFTILLITIFLLSWDCWNWKQNWIKNLSEKTSVIHWQLYHKYMDTYYNLAFLCFGNIDLWWKTWNKVLALQTTLDIFFFYLSFNFFVLKINLSKGMPIVLSSNICLFAQFYTRSLVGNGWNSGQN